jgi:hypothetical protein
MSIVHAMENYSINRTACICQVNWMGFFFSPIYMCTLRSDNTCYSPLHVKLTVFPLTSSYVTVVTSLTKSSSVTKWNPKSLEYPYSDIQFNGWMVVHNGCCLHTGPSKTVYWSWNYRKCAMWTLVLRIEDLQVCNVERAETIEWHLKCVLLTLVLRTGDFLVINTEWLLKCIRIDVKTTNSIQFNLCCNFNKDIITNNINTFQFVTKMEHR